MKTILNSVLATILCVTLFEADSFGQYDKRFVDSIFNSLLTYKTDTEKINKLNGICDNLIWHSSKVDVVDTLADNALLMAQEIQFKKGIADAYIKCKFT